MVAPGGRELELQDDQAAKDAADEAAEFFEASLETMDPLAQLEVLKKRFLGKRSSDDDDDDDGKSRAEVLPAVDKFTRTLEHLRASATQHLPGELHLRAVDGPGYVVVDLADDSGNVVLITADGWQVTDVRKCPGLALVQAQPDDARSGHPGRPGGRQAGPGRGPGGPGRECQAVGHILSGLIGAYFPSLDRPGWWLTGPSGSARRPAAG